MAAAFGPGKSFSLFLWSLVCSFLLSLLFFLRVTQHAPVSSSSSPPEFPFHLYPSLLYVSALHKDRTSSSHIPSLASTTNGEHVIYGPGVNQKVGDSMPPKSWSEEEALSHRLSFSEVQTYLLAGNNETTAAPADDKPQQGGGVGAGRSGDSALQEVDNLAFQAAEATALAYSKARAKGMEPPDLAAIVPEQYSPSTGDSRASTGGHGNRDSERSARAEATAKSDADRGTKTLPADGGECIIFAAEEGDNDNCMCPEGFVLCNWEDVLSVRQNQEITERAASRAWIREFLLKSDRLPPQTLSSFDSAAAASLHTNSTYLRSSSGSDVDSTDNTSVSHADGLAPGTMSGGHDAASSPTTTTTTTRTAAPAESVGSNLADAEKRDRELASGEDLVKKKEQASDFDQLDKLHRSQLSPALLEHGDQLAKLAAGKVAPAWLKALCSEDQEEGFRDYSVYIDYEVEIKCATNSTKDTPDFEFQYALNTYVDPVRMQRLKAKTPAWAPRHCLVSDFYLCKRAPPGVTKVDCTLGEWSEWSEKCGEDKTQLRKRRIHRSGQHGGSACVWDGKQPVHPEVTETRPCEEGKGAAKSQ